MKISKIAALCKKTKKIMILEQERADDDALQWVGDGAGFYAMEGFPKIRHDSIMRLFDIDPDDESTWFIKEDKFPETYDLSIYQPDDCIAEFSMENKITMDGITFIPVKEQGKYYFLNEKYFSPLKIEQKMQLIKRETNGIQKRPYFLLTDGMFPFACIAPGYIDISKYPWLKNIGEDYAYIQR